MSCKQRLRRLENKNPIDLIAFFSLPRALTNRIKVESKMWEDFVKNGGDKSATPAFLPNLTETHGFVCCANVSLLKEWVMNKSKNPAEFGFHL